MTDVADADHAGDDDGAHGLAMHALDIFQHARAAGARDWPAWYSLKRVVPPQSARKGARMISTCARGRLLGRMCWT
eukprot:8922442-Pyramimonas_sp.AAC.1